MLNVHDSSVRLRLVSAGAGMVAAAIGGYHLFAWFSGAMTYRGFQHITIKTNSALCLFLSSIAVIIVALGVGGGLKRRLVQLLAVAVLTIGALTILEHLFGWDLGMDQFLALEPAGAMGFTHPNRMGPPSAATFTMGGISLLLMLQQERAVRVAQWLALAIGFLALMGMVGYLYGVKDLYGAARFTVIALPATIGNFFFSVGLLFARAREGLVGSVTAPDPGGVIIRRLLPAALLFPIVLGYLRLQGEWHGLYAHNFGTSILILSWIAIFSFLIYRGGGWISRIAERRSEDEERFRRFVEASAQVIWTTNERGEVQMDVPAWQTYTGQSREQARGFGWMDAIAPEDRNRVAEAWTRAFESRGIYEVEYRLRRHDGQWRDILARGVPTFNDQGTIREYLGTCTDITTRKRAEAALRDSESKYRAIFEQSAVGMGRVSFTDARWIDVNAAFCTMLGYTSAEMLATPWPEITHSEDVDLDLVSFRRMASGELENYSVEKRFIHKNGHPVWARLTLSLVRKADGTADYEIAIIEDISPRKDAEAALRQSEERFRGVFENAAVGIGLFDGNLSAHVANMKLCEILRYPEEELLGRSFRSFIHPDDLEPDATKYAQLMRGELQSYTVEKRYIRKDGNQVWVRVTRSAQPGARGVPEYTIGLIEDISARKEAEEARERLLGEVQRSNQDLQQFAYVASHDLQEPLRMVSSYIQLLERKYKEHLDEKAQQYIHYAVDGCTRMQSLIEALLRYSRISSDKQFSAVDTSSVYAAAVANLEQAIGSSDGQVTADPLPMVQGDEPLLVQLFQNLIGNALKYRKPGAAPVVHVAVRPEGKKWLFSVKDNGIGIEPRHFEKVFQIFQRLHTREEYPGTGIGLASCKKIVERHGGRIWVESIPGEGSTFFFTLQAPAAAEADRGDQP